MKNGGAVSLQDMGGFHVGGRKVTVCGQPVQSLYVTPEIPDHPYDPNGDYIIEQAYLQYFIPTDPVCELPILFQHGGGLTGAQWERTPDGRPGWLWRFLQAGFTCYVIDNVERGRAGWCTLPDVWSGAALTRPAQEAWWLFRIGMADGFAARETFPNCRFDPAYLDALVASFVPRWFCNGAAQVAALGAAMETIGPCILIAHSEGGHLVQSALFARPDLAPLSILIEPSGYPEPPDLRVLSDNRLLFLMADNLDTPFWRAPAAKARQQVAALRGAGVDATYLELPERGIHGNTHAPMLDNNSDQIAALVRQWIAEKL
ncbi:MAG: hypothetical protein O2967_02860 [Proteobacteria bacterium]|nr:hypothetical protein [Pseudomonadota bacterium]